MKSLHALVAAAFVFSASGAAIAGPGEDLIAKEKCNKCHTEKTTKKGPSFASLAAKYKADAAAPAKLAEMLKTGGKEDHQVVKGSEADLKAIVAVVLAAH
ncbi:Cytochrome c domain-containing protein [Rubrivivax sp. A210]|uniref:cytochrome C n=1 Tax=Rubrivivax sp. A210 TaxID=2772301 RepID=UPI0019194145|nr:cytochrome C [Rubrivivax sp. A210]CAD5375034.1 Cytochrome c domain-containing protein [Rubrivivax sp. A210]